MNSNLNPEIIEEIFSRFNALAPSPKTELNYENNFTLALAVILSAQSTDKGVNIATKELFAKAKTPESIIELGINGLKNHIKSIGLFNNKAKNIMALSEILIRQYNSEIPDNFDELIKLPGIGRKTANVILNCAFGKHTMPVDTHVARVSARLGLSAHKNPDKIEEDLLHQIPSKWMNNAHHWLILHGRYICKARNPLCLKCPINDLCITFKKN